MNATITVVCYKSKTLKNGESPIMLRVCKDNKKKYQSLGKHPLMLRVCKPDLTNRGHH